MVPGPGGVAAALLLVVGVGVEGGDEQAGVAVGPQVGVDLVQIAFAGLDREPVDELAHQGGIDFGGALVFVLVDKDDVEVAAVAEFLAAELAVGNDGELRVFAVPPGQAAPAPARGDAQHGLGQRAQVVGHLFHRQAAFDVARQRAEHLGVMGAAQQVEQGFVVVLAGAGQRLAAMLKFLLELGRGKALVEHVGVGQLVDHARMQQQVARRPARRTQDAQQALVHVGAFEQQGQVAFAPQQRLDPVGQAHGRGLGDAAVADPLRGA